jgi:hypothetical protein
MAGNVIHYDYVNSVFEFTRPGVSIEAEFYDDDLANAFPQIDEFIREFRYVVVIVKQP